LVTAGGPNMIFGKGKKRMKPQIPPIYQW
jgi:hypothetical protein